MDHTVMSLVLDGILRLEIHAMTIHPQPLPQENRDDQRRLRESIVNTGTILQAPLLRVLVAITIATIE
jgi:hypothetical protein